jgi:N utilization substance protein A
LASIYQSIELLGKEKGIDPQIILDAVKDAMVLAARKHFRSEENMEVDFDRNSGAISLHVVKNVVEEVADPVNQLTLEEAQKIDPGVEMGGVVKIPRDADALGRISAQLAKQVILQKVREAERETLFAEFSGRVGDLLTCTVKRIEGPDLIVDLGKTEARLLKKEQSKLESFTVGERIRVVIRAVEKSGKNAGVIVSRAAPELVQRLFEQEVPEIYDGTVQIKACAREAGERTKIAVASRDRDVDSVGACVGMKGMRVQSIIRELRGEKIDIIEFNEDVATFATSALSPARITRVAILDPVEKHMEVIVDDTQLSLAIGKKGQNVRLAAKLLGWRIDIKSEEEKRQEVESQMAAMAPGAPVSVLVDYGLDPAVVDRLMEGGVGTVEQLGSMTPEQLEQLPGVEMEHMASLQASVVSYYAQFEQASEVFAPDREGAGATETALAEDESARGDAVCEPSGEDAVEPVPETSRSAGETTPRAE